MICLSAWKIVFQRGLSDPSCGFGGWCYECGILSWVGWKGLVGWIWMSIVYSGYLPLEILRWKRLIGRWEGRVVPPPTPVRPALLVPHPLCIRRVYLRLRFTLHPSISNAYLSRLTMWVLGRGVA